jgi:hypothetical protein
MTSFLFCCKKTALKSKNLSCHDCFFDLMVAQLHDSSGNGFFQPFFQEIDVNAIRLQQMTQKRRNASVLASLVAKLCASFACSHPSSAWCASNGMGKLRSNRRSVVGATVFHGNPHHFIRDYRPQAAGG